MEVVITCNYSVIKLHCNYSPADPALAHRRATYPTDPDASTLVNVKGMVNGNSTPASPTYMPSVLVSLLEVHPRVEGGVHCDAQCVR